MWFTMLDNEKMPVRGIKTRSSKNRKIEFFPKVHAFGQKLALFQKFYFREYRPGKSVLRYWITKKWQSKV